MDSFQSRPSGSKTTRKVTPFQFAGAVIAFVLVAILSGVLAAGLFIPAVGALGVAAKSVPSAFEEIPAELDMVVPSQESRMLDSEGREITRFFAARRVVKPSEEISVNVKNAIVAIEDRRFYTHHGIDPDGLVRAAFNNATSSDTQGGSTITQQYVKNMLMEQGMQAGNDDLISQATERSVERKLREARYAMAIETKFTKDEILTGYLNLVPFGPNIYGVETGAQTYFSTSAAELTVGQAAILAGIVQSPTNYDPLEYPDESQVRRDAVLESMLELEYIDQAQYDEAVSVSVADMLKPNLLKQGCEAAGTMAYFCDYVVSDFLRDEAYGATSTERLYLLQTGGLTLRTTIDRRIHDAAYQAAVDRVPVYDPSRSGLDTAIVSLVPTTGRIVAMAQNTDYGIATEEQYRSTMLSYNVYTDHRGGQGFQPGSTFKVFTIVEWFNEEKGAYDPVGSKDRLYPTGSFKCDGTVVPTAPYLVNDLAGKDGVTDLVRAAKLSINQAFVSMASKLNYCQIFNRAADLGVVDVNGNPLTGENASQIIGGATDVAPINMASAFGAIGNNGVRCLPMALNEVADRDGKIIKSYEPNCNEAISPTVAQQTTTILKWTAASYNNDLGGRPFAAKSGTTDENANTWVVGFTPELATAAWVGTAAQSSRSANDIEINGEYFPALYGGDFVLPMWTQFMSAALENTEWSTIPDVFVGYKPLPSPSPSPSPSVTKKAETAANTTPNPTKTATKAPATPPVTKPSATPTPSVSDTPPATP